MNRFLRGRESWPCTTLVLASLWIALTVAAALADEVAPQEIFQAAKLSAGKEMWKGYGLPNGKLGCAAALCNVLTTAGVKGIHSALVVVVRKQLLDPAFRTKSAKAVGQSSLAARELILRNGEGNEIDNERLDSLARPGDVVLAFMKPPNQLNGGPDAHCGIMGKGGNIFTNDWNDGIWKEINIHVMFDYYPYIRLIRLGGK